jgi:uncharacterized protein (TIGR02145 family)
MKRIILTSVVVILAMNLNAQQIGSFIDSRDGKSYRWVKIGDQVWMAENLAYMTSVSPSSSDSALDFLSTGSCTYPLYYVYGYQGRDVNEAKATKNFQTYGVLYNWPAALEACPAGWHLPTDDEWKTLEMHLGMSWEQVGIIGWRLSNEGGKLKETGTTHWNYNEGANNESGFTALPGGFRYTIGKNYGIGGGGYWWSATEYYDINAWYRYLQHNLSSICRDHSGKEFGLSVRCLKD